VAVNALHYNKVAMDSLRGLNYKATHDYLKQAETCLINAQDAENLIPDNERVKLLALTYNNMGCLFKK